MNIIWKITAADIQKVKNFVDSQDNSFVQRRRTRNVMRQNILLNENTIIKSLMMCLLTTQQRSGPDTPIRKFLTNDPFPLKIKDLQNRNDVEDFTRDILLQNGLNRYINRISKFFSLNMQYLEDTNWELLRSLRTELQDNSTKSTERKVADHLNENLKGFGPKQSRNFLQSLGLSKYEIPIDSRITNWLNNFGFPITLSAGALQDQAYYHFISDGIQELCERADVYPCILDAAIFSSFDIEEWTEENMVY